MALSQQIADARARWRIWLRRALLGALAALVLAIGYAFYVQIDTVLGLQHDQAQLHQELLVLQQNNNSLSQELLLKDDTEYLEYLARKWLGLIRPGEKKAILSPTGL